MDFRRANTELSVYFGKTNTELYVHFRGPNIEKYYKYNVILSKTVGNSLEVSLLWQERPSWQAWCEDLALPGFF